MSVLPALMYSDEALRWRRGQRSYRSAFRLWVDAVAVGPRRSEADSSARTRGRYVIADSITCDRDKVSSCRDSVRMDPEDTDARLKASRL